MRLSPGRVAHRPGTTGMAPAIAWMAVLWSFAVLPHPISGQTNPCPSLYTEVPEDTLVGTVLFTFASAARRIQLDSIYDPRFQGYLGLSQTGAQSYQIVLSRSLDLNTLNPRSPPVPNTNEQLGCDYSRGPTPPTVSIKAIQVMLRCEVLHSEDVVQVTSDVRVAIQDVNSKAPYFLCAPYLKNVNELTPIYTTIFTLRGLATDGDVDGGIAGYQLQTTSSGKFAMSGGASDGAIILQQPLDYDYGQHVFVLNVSTTDIGEPPLSNWTQVFITVTDGDDQNPAFSHAIYYLSLPEQNRSILGQPFRTRPPIEAYDLDFGINATVGYEVDGGHEYDGRTFFEVDRMTGHVFLYELLDRAAKAQFIIRVKAYQLDNPRNRYSTATLIVSVEDANVHRPEMTQLVYNLTIPEHSASGYRVVQVSATDDDVGSNAEFEYHLKGSGSDSFQVEQNSGVIFVSNNTGLDKETTDYLLLQVYAQETMTVERYHSEIANIYVWLEDVNDNSPVFQPTTTYTYLVNRSAAANSIVGQVFAEDIDQGAFGRVVYTILFGTHGASTYFRVDALTGWIYILQSLSESGTNTFILTVQASDQPANTDLTRHAVAMVNITILSGNDHAPRFIGEPYSTSLSEASSYGTTVIQLVASDKDGSELAYHLTDGDHGDQFLLHPSSGVLTLWRPLDREEKNAYNLKVAVTDGLHTTETVVFVNVDDTNDNTPEFEPREYTFWVWEEHSGGTRLGRVTAMDRDAGNNGDVQYRLGGNWASQYFSIDPDTGILYTVVPLDRETTVSHKLTVVAQDGGLPILSAMATVTVLVSDINDHPPKFKRESYQVTVAEMAPPSGILQFQAVDQDEGENAVIQYILARGNNALFGVDATSGVLYSKTKIAIEEGHNQHHLVVVAYNRRPYDLDTVQNKTVTITVTVKDVNDHVPMFSMPVYHAQIYENHPVGSSVLRFKVWTKGELEGGCRVMASDADHSIWNSGTRYWLQEEVGSYKFMVERHTGTLRLIRPLDADPPERDHGFLFTVYASDMMMDHQTAIIRNVTAQVNVTVVDINDNTPQFTRDVYHLTVREDTAPGTTLMEHLYAVDLDSSPSNQLTYDLLTYGVPFEVYMATGQLTLGASLDYDHGLRHYSLLVVAIDNDQPARTGSATIEVSVGNINDNAPVFTSTTFTMSITENLPAKSYVGRVTAVDDDGDNVFYLIQGGDTAMFHLDNVTGQLLTRARLDHETQPAYMLTVMASDMPLSPDGPTGQQHVALATIQVEVIDLNDNAPVFSQRVYKTSVREGSSNQTILQLMAIDLDSGEDGHITFHLLSGDEQGIFHLDKWSGDLIVRHGNLLDHTKEPHHRLVVQARDGGWPAHSTTAEVVVTVDATNSHAPSFTKDAYHTEVCENLLSTTPVVQVSATDPDPLGTLRFQLITPNANFAIDPASGLIITTGPLDREDTPVVNLRVAAYDGIHSSEVQVTVTVCDKNDNSPRFVEASYIRSISQNMDVGRSVVAISATDADATYNGHVTYWLTGTSGRFSIDPDTGLVSIAAKLDKSSQAAYHMKVYARDHGIPARMSHTDLHVYLNDSNRFAPEFSSFVNTVTVWEDISMDTTILQLTVSDRDTGVAGQVSMRVVSGNIRLTFRLDQSGNLVVVKPLDYEEIKYYQLEIEAKDRAENPQSTIIMVHVTVLDINDNAPYMLPVPERLRLFSTLPPGVPIMTFFALDADSAANGNNNLSFALPEQQRFNLNSTSGELSTQDYLGLGTYHVTVRVADHGRPSLYTMRSITIDVLDPGFAQHYPVYAQPILTVALEETTSIPHSVVDVSAWLPGHPLDDSLWYNITAGNETGHFSIARNTGQITLIKRLRWDHQKVHTLVVSAYNEDMPQYSQPTTPWDWMSRVYVVVEVGNSDDESPYFPFTHYSATVSEDAPVGTTIMTIRAFDNDMHDMMWYGVVDRTDREVLRVEGLNNVAVVTVQRPLDRDSMPANMSDIYHLKIGASDGRHYSQPVDLWIKVLDVNDNPPVFNVSTFTASISESAGGCQEVVLARAQDLDRLDDGKIVYSISEGDREMFHIDEATGMLTVRCDDEPILLNRETRDRYSVVVMAMDTAGHHATAKVEITVQDDNDNTPQFTQHRYITHTTEGEASLSLVLMVSATDADLGVNAEIVFVIDSRMPEFTVLTSRHEDYTVGEIRVTRELDREKAGLTRINGSALYEVLVLAIDNGHPALTSTAMVSVYIADVNDNPPVFTEPLYDVTITEGTPPGTSITKVTAHDPDSDAALVYSIIEKGPFSIDPQTGEVHIDWLLDATQVDQYDLHVHVSDGIHTDQVSLTIRLLDMNNNSPIFSQEVYYFRVMENDLSGHLGQVVGQILATDRDGGDNGRVTYYLTSRSARGLFNISEPEVGQIMVVGELDRERVPRHTLIVTAADMGVPPRMSTCEVEIEVDDVNDNAPQFLDTPYLGEVVEQAPPGTTLFVFPPVKTFDLDEGFNTEIKYSLGGSTSSWFAIDPVSGIITVSAEGSSQLDRETTATVVLQIVAEDRNGTQGSLRNLTTFSIVLTDKNDNAPIFAESLYKMDVDEDVWTNTLVGQVTATDADIAPNNRLSYSLLSGADGRFYIDRLTGDILVAGGLDRETKSFYVMEVMVVDGGVDPGQLEGRTKVNISLKDRNDNPPKFGKSVYTFSVPENKRHVLYFGVVQAIDPDFGNNRKVKYSVMTENVPFTIDYRTGWLSLDQPLDREEKSRFVLEVAAHDLGYPSLSSACTVIIEVSDLNDNTPRFEQQLFTVNILELTPVGSVLVYPMAIDGDEGENGQVTYTLHSSQGANEYFSINGSTGLVKVAQPILKAELVQHGLIIEGNDTLYVTLRAADKGNPPNVGEAQLSVHIDDINDDTLQFSRVSYQVALEEEIPADSYVTSVEASSRDPLTQVSYKILHTNLFQIDKHSGTITTNGHRIDREAQTSVSFTVQALDNKMPQGTTFTAILVTLKDINDNQPHFVRNIHEFEVVEGFYEQPFAVGNVTATDDDGDGRNSRLSYSMRAENKPDSPFRLDPRTGELTVIGRVDHENCPYYRLMVQVEDEGIPSLSAFTDVIIDVIDLNDNAPTFDQENYKATITSVSRSGLEVIAVVAADPDQGLNGTVVYELITTHDVTIPFYIQTKGNAGVLHTMGGLDLDTEEPRVYDVIVQASDLGSPPQTTTVHVYVNVTGRSDGKPHFAEDIYEVQIMSDMVVGSTVFMMSAGRGRYYYSIIGGDKDGTFSVREEHGEIILMKQLNPRRMAYELTVQAADNAAPRNIDMAKLWVTVLRTGPVPMFDEREYPVTLAENMPPPQLLVDLNTGDERSGKLVTYYIIDGEHSGMFYLENTTGRLWCTQQLDREEQPLYKVLVGAERVEGSVGVQRRTKRDTQGSPNVAMVTVTVGDENDNPPRFVYSPVIVGVPHDAKINYLVTVLEVEDLDSGNNSAVLFNSSSNDFYVGDTTGELRTKIMLNTRKEDVFEFSVSATDNWGAGHPTSTTVKVFVLANSQRAILVAKIPLAEFEARREELVKALSDILGWRVTIEKLQPHSVNNNDDNNSLDVGMTDMYFYALDTDKGLIVSRADILRRVSEKSKEIGALFDDYRVEEIKPVAVLHPGYHITGSEIALIVISVLIFFGTIIGIVVLYVTHRQAQMVARNPSMKTLAPGYATGRKKSDVHLTNPLYADSEAYSEPLELDSASVAYSSPKTRERETQKITMYLSSENGDSSSSSAQTEFVSFDDDGKAIIVVDNMSASKNGRGQGDGAGWVSPYSGDTYAPHLRKVERVVQDGVIRRALQLDPVPQGVILPSLVFPDGADEDDDDEEVVDLTIGTSFPKLNGELPQSLEQNDQILRLNQFEIGETEL